MNAASPDRFEVGTELPECLFPPLERATLALFAEASGDRNPIHIDGEFARNAGMPDVIAHGMLGMAWLARLVTGWVPQSKLREFNGRFQGVTHLGHATRCKGRVAERLVRNGERCVRIELQCVNQFGETKIVGIAVVALPWFD